MMFHKYIMQHFGIREPQLVPSSNSKPSVLRYKSSTHDSDICIFFAIES